MALSYLYDRYVLKNLGIATLFTSLTLAAIILLTQSLKFLELIMNSGASSAAFWMLTFLALPRFFEVILPLALMIATLFIYNRMMSDSEVVVMRAAGVSPMGMARPAITLGVIITIILLAITTWLAPIALSGMVKMRQVIKTQYSTLLFREGIFNAVGPDLTVYINKRNSKGELEGLLIHDSRPELLAPVTIIAKRGVVVSSDEGQQVLVYDGSRQDFNEKTGALNRLDFKRYSIDMPEPEAVRKRWKEPDERTFLELLHPNAEDAEDMRYREQFVIEAHKRIISPFLALSYVAIALCCLLLGPVNRRGQAKRIFIAVITVIVIQSLFLTVLSLANKEPGAIVLMYITIFFPLFFALTALSSKGEKIRHKIMYRSKTLSPEKLREVS
ncbi:MAG TPA: LPS export ABC transporter permease LptF [Alphaproteobacteria bacterium]|nr:LPS export ABC transporter permease LptF [Alphaproteobacteria bacterium]